MSFPILRGCNFWGLTWPTPLLHEEADYAKIASWGFNVVRLPFAWGKFETAPGVYDDSYFANYIDPVIAWAKKYGMKIILESHHFQLSNYFTSPGAAEGFPRFLFEGLYTADEAGMKAAWGDFWLNTYGWQDAYIAMWRYVAERYEAEDGIAAYDIMNEPVTPTTYKWCKPYLYAFYTNVIDAIRAIDPGRTIITEALIGYGSFMHLQAIERPNLVHSAHYYSREGHDPRHGETPGTWEAEKSLIDDWWNGHLGFARSAGIPFWLGEFAIERVNEPSFPQWIPYIVGLCNVNNVGWAWWAYSKWWTYSVEPYKFALCDLGPTGEPVDYEPYMQWLRDPILEPTSSPGLGLLLIAWLLSSK